MLKLDAVRLANELMAECKLTGWQFQINSNKTRFGVCKFPRQRRGQWIPGRIEISRYHLTDEDYQVKNTILHEIAHAVVGPQHGHNAVWRSHAIAIGCDGERCGKGRVNAPYKWAGTCPSCSTIYKRHRRLHRGSCPFCSHGRFNPAFLIVWKLA